MKIAVVGAGAMGSIFGARFHQAGHETVLVDVAQSLVDTINAEGVTVVRGDDETVTRVPATTEPIGRPGRHRRVLHKVLPHLCGGRGRTSSRRARTPSSPRYRTAGGTATCSRPRTRRDRSSSASRTTAVCSRGPGRVLHPAEQPTLVGSFSDGGDGPRGSRRHSSRGGLRRRSLARTPEIWKKLILNAATLPASALTGMTAGALGTQGHARPRLGDDARGGGRGAGARDTTSTSTSGSARSWDWWRRLARRKRRCFRTLRPGVARRST